MASASSDVGRAGVLSSEAGTGLVPSGLLGTICTLMVAATVAAAAVDIALESYLVSVFDPSGSLADISTTTDDVYLASGFVALFQFVCWIVAGVSFIVLLWRMVRNGAKLTPGKARRKAHWAITGWFIPFLNLIRPFDMVKQAWASTPSKGPGPIFEEPPGYFRLWWGLFIAVGIADRVVAGLTRNGVNTMNQLSKEATWTLVAQIVTVAAGVAFLFVLRALIRRQDNAINEAWRARTDALSAAMHPHLNLGPPPTAPPIGPNNTP